MAKKNQILKISKGTIRLLAKKDVTLKANNIHCSAGENVNETAKQGVFFGN